VKSEKILLYVAIAAGLYWLYQQYLLNQAQVQQQQNAAAAGSLGASALQGVLSTFGLGGLVGTN
jgi:lipopolysaccharide export system protein LptC